MNSGAKIYVYILCEGKFLNENLNSENSSILDRKTEIAKTP